MASYAIKWQVIETSRDGRENTQVIHALVDKSQAEINKEFDTKCHN